MQIREITLRELFNVYELLKPLYNDLKYDQFEDLIYDMRELPYVMLGVFEGEDLLAYAGVSIRTDLVFFRHLEVFECSVASVEHKTHFAQALIEYIIDYAKMGACRSVVLRYERYVPLCKEMLLEKGFIFEQHAKSLVYTL